MVSVQSLLADERQELASYLEAHRANWESLRRFDVLVRTDEFREPSTVPGRTETVFERIAMDWEQKKFLYAASGRRESLAEGRPTETLDTGFVVSGGRFRTFRPSSRHLPAQEFERVEQVFDSHKMPDLRLLMFMSLGRGSSRPWTDNRSNYFRVFPQTAETVRLLSSSDGRVKFEAFFDNNAGSRWSFDTGTLDPIVAEWLVEDPDSGEILKVGEEEYRWTTIASIRLPEVVEGNYRVRQPTIPPREILAIPKEELTPEKVKSLYRDSLVNRDMRFSWLAVNEELPEDLFVLSQVDDPTSFLRLCNPKVHGAENLIDVVETSSK